MILKGPTADPTTPSTAAAQPGAPMMTTPNGMVTPTTAQPVKVGKGMNPAHGQPGHRCDVAVGAPLNSAPAKTTTLQRNLRLLLLQVQHLVR